MNPNEVCVQQPMGASITELLGAAVEQVAEAILLTESDGVILYANKAFVDLTGYSLQETIGENPRILSSGMQNSEFYGGIWKQITSGKVWSGTIINRKKSGELYTANLTISPILNPNGSVTHYIGIQRNITRELELESQLQQAQKLEAVGSLAAGIAHEINTPIQFVGSNTEFLRDGFNDILKCFGEINALVDQIPDEGIRSNLVTELEQVLEKHDIDYYRKEIDRAIEQTLDGVRRVASIVRGMKDFSHQDNGELSSVDLNDLIATTLTVSVNEYKYFADIKLDFAEDLPEIECYCNQLHQVALNLIVNATHAIADHLECDESNRGTITIKTARDGEHVVLTITDDGCGIPEKHRERIFEQFYTTKEVGRGTGQGLAICRSIVVDGHGGSLAFDTEVGKGTTFHVRLPIKQKAHQEELQ